MVRSFVRKPLFVDVMFTLSSGTVRYFSRGSSPLCSSVRLLRPSGAEFQPVRGLFVAAVSLTTTTQHLRTLELLFEKKQVLVCHVFCACHNRFGGKKFQMHQQ